MRVIVTGHRLLKFISLAESASRPPPSLPPRGRSNFFSSSPWGRLGGGALRLPATSMYITLHFIVEVSVFHQVLQRKMHPEAPIMFGICRDIYPFVIGVWPS